MQRFARLYANHLNESGTIANVEREVYVYGMEILLNSGRFTVVALLLGLLSGTFAEVFAFLLAYMPVRSCIGGYHSKHPTSCLLSSLAIALGTLYVANWMPHIVLPIVLAVSTGLVFTMAPIIHPNNPHSQKRCLELRKLARMMSILESAIILIISLIRADLAAVMALAYFAACLGMPAAKLAGQNLDVDV